MIHTSKDMNLRISCFMFLLCACLCSSAQQASYAHAFRAGDKVERQQVTYKEFAKNENCAIWDLSDIESSGHLSLLEFMENPQDKQGVIANDGNTRYCYHQSESGMFLVGYENNQSNVCYNMPEPTLLSSMVVGSKVTGCFSGYAVYAESVFSRIYGTSEYSVDEEGTLILPSNDSIEDVKRVHVLKTTGQRYLSEVENSKALRILVDSASVYTTDSVLQHLAADSILVESNVYKWYAKGYRYPIYETIESHVKGNPIGLKVAYFCSPQFQKTLNDADNEKERAVASKSRFNAKRNNLQGNHNYIFPDGTYVDYSLSLTSDGRVNVTLFCTSAAKISCGIYTVNGVVVGQKEYDGDSRDVHSFSHSLSSYSHGVYIFCISVNGQTLSEKFTY